MIENAQVIDDPHVIWAIVCVTFALVLAFLDILIRLANDEKNRKR